MSFGAEWYHIGFLIRLGNTTMAMRELLARIATFRPVFRALSTVLRAPVLTALTYHSIGDFDGLDPDAETVSASLADLEWQIAWLRDHVRVLGGEEVAAFAHGRAELAGPSVCLTFDDAFEEHLRVGELLADFGLPAVFFVATDYVGSAGAPDWYRIVYAVKRSTCSRIVLPRRAAVSLKDRERAIGVLHDMYNGLPPAEQPVFVSLIEESARVRAADGLAAHPRWLSWDAVRRLRSLGHTIGSHTRSHRVLAKLSATEQRDELDQSRRRIEHELGTPVKLLAYPFGSSETFDAETKRAAAACGYQAAFSYYGGSNRAGAIDPFDVRRVSVVRSRAIFRIRAGLPGFSANPVD